MRTKRSFFLVGAVVLASSALACGGSDPTETRPTDAGTDSTPTCAPVGNGTIVVNVVGLPSGVNAKVVLTGPGGAQTVTATQTFASAAAGNYTAAAENVVAPDPIVRTVYTPTVSSASFCLANAQSQTITVTYAAVPSSNKLWIANANSPDNTPLEGFSSASLAATGNPRATVALRTGTAGQIAFDKDGNYWSVGGTTADSNLGRHPASDLAASGAKVADRKIDLGLRCSPPVAAIAFDKTGNLWVASPCDKKVLRVAAAQLAASGEVTPAVTIALADNPQGLAFDKMGNLWVTDAQTLKRFDAASLAANGATAAVTISVKTKADGTGAPLSPGFLAFDGAGDLWTSDFGGNVVYRIPSAELAGAGTKELVPPVQITIGVSALLEALAFDEGGGLWTSFSVGKFVRLAPAQLTVSSSAGAPAVPDRVLSSPDMGSADGFAFYPAPATSPLYSALP